jgi:hypothetical protein
MAADDFLEPEVGVAAAATAALLSPGVRGVMRKGLVYGTAGVMTAGDAVVSVAKGAGRGVQRAVGGRGSEATPAPAMAGAARSAEPATERTTPAAGKPRATRTSKSSPSTSGGPQRPGTS